jgi:hypothetical protein
MSTDESYILISNDDRHFCCYKSFIDKSSWYIAIEILNEIKKNPSANEIKLNRSGDDIKNFCDFGMATNNRFTYDTAVMKGRMENIKQMFAHLMRH